MSDTSDAPPASASFQLASASTSASGVGGAPAASDQFANRMKDVFSFDEVRIRPTGQPSGPDTPHDEGHGHGGQRDTSHFKGRESLFRVPENEWKRPERLNRDRDRDRTKNTGPDRRERAKDNVRNRNAMPYQRGAFGGGRGGGGGGRGGRGRMVPDFKKNPEKYTKYSLADVDDVTHRSNQQAAYAFLNDLKKKKREEEEEEEETIEENSADKNDKITFKKPVQGPRASEKEMDNCAPSTKKSVFVMPECVAGASRKVKANKKLSQKKVEPAKQMTLSHLMDEEEEED